MRTLILEAMLTPIRELEALYVMAKEQGKPPRRYQHGLVENFPRFPSTRGHLGFVGRRGGGNSAIVRVHTYAVQLRTRRSPQALPGGTCTCHMASWLLLGLLAHVLALAVLNSARVHAARAAAPRRNGQFESARCSAGMLHTARLWGSAGLVLALVCAVLLEQKESTRGRAYACGQVVYSCFAPQRWQLK